MIGVTAGAGRSFFLLVATFPPPATSVALGVTGGALAGSHILPQANLRSLRLLFVAILIMIAAENGMASGRPHVADRWPDLVRVCRQFCVWSHTT
jgi:uncharacterized membrane protein YfcA